MGPTKTNDQAGSSPTTARTWVVDLGACTRDDVAQVGGKAANLGELIGAGLPVPPGFVVTTDAYDEYVASNDLQQRIVGAADTAEDHADTAARTIAALFAAGTIPEPVARAVADAYATLGEEPATVAVRSSATAEDLPGASFAGQQDTYLNITGADAVLQAVRRCWASLWTERALAYRAHRGIRPEHVSLAVVVQRLVDADAAGVMFTADPATGSRDTVIISAAWGIGEAVVGGLVDTDQLTLHGPDLAITSRHVADKAVRTVRTPTGTAEEPVPAEQRTAPVLDDAAARALAGLGRRIDRHFAGPQDIEWARDGDRLWIVQSRPITALPEPVGPVPTDWPAPRADAWCFRGSIVEQLPDPLTPLFAELIAPAVTSSITAIMDEVLGNGTVRPGDVGFPTVNGYAYYLYDRGGMLRLLRQTPRAMRLAFGRHGMDPQHRWETRSRPAYQHAVDAWTGRDLSTLPADQLLDGVTELVLAGATYYTAVQTIIPIAATSEIALTRYYDAFVRRDGDPPASALLLGFDSQPIRAERSLWDLARWLRTQHPELADWWVATRTAEVLRRLDLDGQPVEQPVAGAERAAPAGADQVAARFAEHLATFGHPVYNLDFVNPVPADDPVPLVDTVRLYLSGRAGDPYARQRTLQHRRDAATLVIRRRLDPLRRSTFDALLRKAQAIAPVREDALADVGLAWPQLRRMLAELGRRLVEAGAVDAADDVFWCRRDEVAGALAPSAVVGTDTPPADLAPADLPPADLPPADLRGLVEERRQVWRGQRRATPPQVLPVGTVMDRLGPLMPATMADQTGNVLTGIAASAGRVTATARVLAGPADFARLQPGDVLVASITTPAWTSLFARAGAVVTDIGGPLSHSSIVAREYGIPAVLGTAVATRRIVDGQQITVDGDAGRVHLTDAGSAVAPAAHRRRNRWLIAGAAGAAVAGLAAGAILRSRPGRTASAASRRPSSSPRPPRACAR